MRVCLSWSIFFAARAPMSPLPARAYQLAEVAVLRNGYTPLAQRALYHLFSGHALGVFGDRPFPERCWRWSAGSWFNSMVAIEGSGVRKSGLPRSGLLDRVAYLWREPTCPQQAG
jgi:hypothetical protein